MTVQQLRRPALAGLVAAAQAAVDEAGTVPPRSVGTDELAESITGLAKLESMAVALRLSLSKEADDRHVADATAETGTDVWLARLTGDTREVMAGGLLLARRLQETYHATRESLAAGRLRLQQARVIVDAAEQAPPEATAEQVAAAEEWLVGKATGQGTRSGRPMNATRLRQAARRMFALVDADLAARHEAILLGREHRNAEANTYLQLHDNGDGTFSGRFTIPELHGHLFRQAIERLSSPRRLGRDRQGGLVVDESAPGTDTGHNIDEARGQAFCEVIEHLPTVGHSTNGVTLVVTIDLQALLKEFGTAGLDTGTRITAGETRRLACNAGLVPAVLGTSSLPLDLGRTARLHSAAQRKALAIIHDTCAVSGCERPFAWCEIHHHKLAWSQGGSTDLDNALPLCGHHHRRAHDAAWDLRRHPDGDYRFHRRR